MTKATTHFFLVIFHNHRQFSFFNHNISVDTSSLVSLCFSSFLFIHKVFQAHPSVQQTKERRRTAPNGPIPAVFWGVEVGSEKMSSFFLT